MVKIISSFLWIMFYVVVLQINFNSCDRFLTLIGGPMKILNIKFKHFLNFF